MYFAAFWHGEEASWCEGVVREATGVEKTDDGGFTGKVPLRFKIRFKVCEDYHSFLSLVDEDGDLEGKNRLACCLFFLFLSVLLKERFCWNRLVLQFLLVAWNLLVFAGIAQLFFLLESASLVIQYSVLATMLLVS
ncbi:hypothetical protein L1987_08563 [Smallanthus sonchifolius]|uniref:Uncharacterized protein n=1 Tax=Smallanthus sonchifolius TaxID=185202 RepID=A0ACB9JNZ7_9ASTR|nr:hypothetical protein L1987_08563 [Smallanthus sonchifolius]